jgi:hypothetical protein
VLDEQLVQGAAREAAAAAPEAVAYRKTIFSWFACFLVPPWPTLCGQPAYLVIQLGERTGR